MDSYIYMSSSIFQSTKDVKRKLAPVFKILLNNDTGFLLWHKERKVILKALISRETVKNFSCFCLDVESLVTHSNKKKADF